MTKTEWIARCKAQYIRRGEDPRWAEMFAATKADDQADLHGASTIAWERPEDVADEDLAEEARQ
jgi:hypothetical protein